MQSHRGCHYTPHTIAPNVIPGEEVEIESNSVVGRFKVDKVTHAGDIYGSEWFSEIEVVEIPK